MHLHMKSIMKNAWPWFIHEVSQLYGQTLPAKQKAEGHSWKLDALLNGPVVWFSRGNSINRHHCGLLAWNTQSCLETRKKKENSDFNEL